MKKNIQLIAIGLFVLCAYDASASSPHVYANYITANNIAAIQHSIATNTMRTFEGNAAATLGGIAKMARSDVMPSESGNARDMYGTLPMYGRPHLYGEYGDDGTVNTPDTGRSGGDDASRPVLNSMWFNWQHFDEDVGFSNYDVLDTNYDLLSFGVAGGEAQWGIGISEWGFYGGYLGGKQGNESIDINENGGYFGLYSGYNIQNFNLSFIANIGAVSNHASSEFGTDGFSTPWVGAALNATYNIPLDDTFTIQPGIYAGYTWIGSADYISASGDNIANSNFNIFDVVPSIRAIKHIGAGWFGYIGLQYVFRYDYNGDIFVNNEKYTELFSDDYAEYGIGIEKSIDRFNIALHLNRHDGGRTGWNGGVNIKYIF